jgi:hypothetical protein
LTIEEHGGGKQLLRFRCWSQVSNLSIFLFSLFVLTTLFAIWDGAVLMQILFGTASLFVVWKVLQNSAKGVHSLSNAFLEQQFEPAGTQTSSEEVEEEAVELVPSLPKVAAAKAFSNASEVFAPSRLQVTETKYLD